MAAQPLTLREGRILDLKGNPASLSLHQHVGSLAVLYRRIVDVHDCVWVRVSEPPSQDVFALVVCDRLGRVSAFWIAEVPKVVAARPTRGREGT
jgi:hypothetical protein